MADTGEPRHDARGCQAIAGLDIGLTRLHEGRRRGTRLVSCRLLAGEVLEDAPAIGRRRVRGQVADGPPVQLHGLAMRGDPRGRSRAGERGPMRLIAAARELEVRRRVDLGADVALATEVGDQSMQPTAFGHRDRGVDGVPQQLVAEVDLARASGGLEEGVRDELVEPIGEGLVGQLDDPADDRRQEPPADDGAGRGDRLRGVRTVAQPLEDRGLDRLRDVGGPDVVGRRHRAVREHAHELLDVERDAIRALVDRLDGVFRHRAPFQEDPRHDGRLVEGEPRQPGLFREALGQQPGTPLDESGVGRDLLDPERRDQEQGSVGEPPGQRTDHLEAQVVGPVQVLESEEGRLGGGIGERIDDVEHVHPAALGDGLRTTLVRRQAVHQGLADRCQ